MITGPTGFSNAPLSKLLWVIVLASSLIAVITDGAELFWFDPYRVSSSPSEFWRAFSSSLFLHRPLEIFTALITLYQWRIFERQMGTAKLSVLALVSFLCYSLALVASVAAAIAPARWWLSWLTRESYGPHWIIFSCLVLYTRDIPPSYGFRIFGIPLTNKIFVYVLAVQCFLAGFPGSIAGTLSGLAAGLLYRMPALAISEIRIPRRVSDVFAAVFLPILEPRPAPVAAGAGRALGRDDAAAAAAFAGAATAEALGAMPADVYAASDVVGHGATHAEALTPTVAPASAPPGTTQHRSSEAIPESLIVPADPSAVGEGSPLPPLLLPRLLTRFFMQQHWLEWGSKSGELARH